MLIGFRLKPGRDDDLIIWLESLGSGDRSYHIREAIRRGLSASPKRPEAPVIKVKPGKIKDLKAPVKKEDLESALDSW